MKNRYDYICEEVQQAKDSRCSNPSGELLFYYRGHSDIDWDLVPTIIRSRRKVTEYSEICRAMNDGNWSLADSAFVNIARMQHYGYATRFLDYTTSLDVALYFACNDSNYYHRDGCISICPYSSNETSFSAEYLLNESSELEIVKKYPNGGTAKVYVRANHPKNPMCCDLLSKTNAELKKLLNEQHIDCDDRTKNACIRTAIWRHYSDDLQLEPTEIELSKGDGKSIKEKVLSQLPVYALFQADRKNCDGDSEIQDPLKVATKTIMQSPEVADKLAEVANLVRSQLRDVAQRTLDKLREMDQDVANSLTPVIPDDTLKWWDVFKSVTITGDNDIPINKRGSGVRRLILLSFFRAEADRAREATDNQSIIYAIEEPETSQHAHNQQVLINSLKEIAQSPGVQVILTTHSGFVVKSLGFENIRLIYDDAHGKNVLPVNAQSLPYPSLNEINYIVFDEITEEYHDELYGYIVAEDKLSDFIRGKPKRSYIRDQVDRHTHQHTAIHEQKILTEYIRHQIHHPENRLNTHYTQAELKESIELMRTFIALNMNSPEEL